TAAHTTRASLAIDRNFTLVPSVQPIRRTQPKTSILRSQNRRNPSAGQTLLYRKRWDGEVAKPVQALYARRPNIALPILQERVNGSARKAIGWGKQIGSSLVDVQQPLVD